MKIICSEEEILADYLEGRLSDEKRRWLEAYLSDCDHCLEELLVAKNLIQNSGLPEFDPVPKRVTEEAVHLLTNMNPAQPFSVKDAVFHPLKRLWSWASSLNLQKLYTNTTFAPVRSYDIAGSVDIFHTKKSFEKIETEIEIEKTSNDSAVIRVHLVSDTQNKYNIRVTLLNKDQREISSFLLNGGYVVFEDIHFDHYSLVFLRNGTTIGAYQFEIKDTRYGRGKKQASKASSRQDGKGTAGTGTPGSNH